MVLHNLNTFYRKATNKMNRVLMLQSIQPEIDFLINGALETWGPNRSTISLYCSVCCGHPAPTMCTE